MGARIKRARTCIVGGEQSESVLDTDAADVCNSSWLGEVLEGGDQSMVRGSLLLWFNYGVHSLVLLLLFALE